MSAATEASSGLDHRTSSAAVARRFVTKLLTGWRLDPLVEVATLLTSELVTNAIVHAEAPLEVRVQREGEVVRIGVHDASARLPRVQHPAPTAMGGRGMWLIDTLAAAWGVDTVDGDGKTVWFEVATTPAPAGGGRATPRGPS